MNNSFANTLKDKYAKLWALTSIREDIARKWLQLVLNLKEEDIVVNGIGVMSTEKTDETWEGDPFRKFDFYLPKYKLYLDITGTSFSKFESIKRAHRLGLNGAIIAILGVKVSVGEILESKGYHTAFVSVNDNEGEIRFMPYTRLKVLEKNKRAFLAEPSEFAKGERTYVITKWKDWLKPNQFKNWVSRK
ncbi:hypothetical protein [Sulfolobus spindle-shaped virus]|nr:hypothetical protein [Sulfolobus spindle-shaped virus]